MVTACHCPAGAQGTSKIGSKCSVDDIGCATLDPVHTILSGVTAGYKICGRRGGQTFLEMLRPEKRTNLDDTDYLRCPGMSVPCDDDPYSETQSAQEVLFDANAKENKIYCAPTKEECPITGMSLRYDEAQETMVLETFKNANDYALTKFVLAAGRPCLSPHELNQDKGTIFTDELSSGLAPCTVSQFYGGGTDERFTTLNLEILQQTFDVENGLKNVIDTRYKSSDRDNTIIRNLRAKNTIRPYVRPVIGWNLSCEIGDKHQIGRQEIFDSFIGTSFESQNPANGAMSEDLVMAAMITALVMLFFFASQCARAACSKDDEEDETLVMLNKFAFDKPLAFCGFVSTVLLMITLYEFIVAMALTATDMTTIRDNMEILSDCMDRYSAID